MSLGTHTCPRLLLWELLEWLADDWAPCPVWFQGLTICPAVLPACSNVVDGESAVESGEWEAVESLGSQDDVLAWYNHQHETRNTRLHDVMQVQRCAGCLGCGSPARPRSWRRSQAACSRALTPLPLALPPAPPPLLQTNLVVTSPGASLAEVTALLDGPPSIEGMPVVDGDNKVRYRQARQHTSLALPPTPARHAAPCPLTSSSHARDAHACLPRFCVGLLPPACSWWAWCRARIWPRAGPWCRTSCRPHPSPSRPLARWRMLPRS